MNIESTNAGTKIETDFFVAHFGNKNADVAQLQRLYPQIQFKRIKQIHGHRAVHTSPHTIDFSNEADAQYTSEKRLGLCIATADCIPVLIYHHEPQWIASIHAGWRGIEAQIVPKTLNILQKNGCQIENTQILVGPHIQMESFEVGNDVRDRLLKDQVSYHGTDLFWKPINGEKSLVDLHQLLKTQLIKTQIPLENVYFEFKDTVTDQSYHSHRRDRENAGRQISFIALT